MARRQQSGSCCWMRFVNVDHIELVSSIVNAGINPKAGYEAEVERALLEAPSHLQCWKKSERAEEISLWAQRAHSGDRLSP